MTNLLILGAAGYLLGSIPFSYIIPKMLSNVDIREHGSGNLGSTNVYRILGKKAGLLAFIGDFLKGFSASILGQYFGGLEGGLICGGLAMIGHCYPITMGFKGGKGVATSAGMITGLHPLMALILFIVQVLIILRTRYVGLASIIVATLLPVVTYILKLPDSFIYFSLFMGIFVIYRHRENISRLINGTESKI